MKRRRLRCAYVFPWVLLIGDPARAADPESHPPRELRSVELNLGPARLMVERAVLVPLAPGASKPMEWALVGAMTFHFRPGDPSERQQMRLFTGGEALAEPVSEVVLVAPGDDVNRVLSAHPPLVPDAAAVSRLGSVSSKWKASLERRALGVDAVAFRAAGGDPLVEGFLAAWCRSDRFGAFFFAVDPRRAEPVAVRRFVPLDLGDAANERLRRQVRDENRQGRLAGLRLEDLGDLDVWSSEPLRDEAGSPFRTGDGVEPLAYRLDVRLDPAAGRLTGTAFLDLESGRQELRAFALRLFPDLIVKAIADDRGRPLPFHQERHEVSVLLNEPLDTGARFGLEVRYGGVAFDTVRSSTYHLRSTTAWYPHVGDIDRATYDVTYRWPKGLVLLASGRREDGGSRGSEAWERRTLTFPADEVSFEIGDYHVESRTVDEVEFRVGFMNQPRRPPESQRTALMDLLESAFRFHQSTFGPYPLENLTVVLTERDFSQGLLGIVTLAETRRDTVSHELAHQWWGNKVGWKSYRDQWLSEALAMYASSAFLTKHQTREFDESDSRSDRNLAYARLMDARRRRTQDLLDRTDADRYEVSLGPATMGYRLDSSLSGWAYSTIVYSKGARLISELGVLLGEERLQGLLRNLATTSAGKVIDTGDFVDAVAKAAGPEVGRMYDQLVGRRGLAMVYYEYRTVPDEAGGFKIVGRTTNLPTGWSRYHLKRVGDSGWDLVGEFEPDWDPASWAAVVPYLITYATEAVGDPKAASRRSGDATKRGGFRGRTLLSNLDSTIEISSQKPPDELVLDSGGNTTAVYFSMNAHPSRMILRLADEFAARGDAPRAEALYRRILEPPSSDPLHGDLTEKRGDSGREVQMWRARAWLGIADLRIEAGDEAGAREALTASKREIPNGLEDDFRVPVLLRETRFALRHGNGREAYDALARELSLEFKQREGEDASQQFLRRRFASEGRWSGTAQDYARLAVAAHLVGEEKVCRRASKEATSMGAIMTLLDSLHDESP